jgi:hypothetical protein
MPSAVRGVCHVVLLALLIPVVLVWGYDCVDQDITTVITLTPGGTHSLTRCHVHSGGQVVLTGGGTLTVVSSTVTAGWDHIPKIVVESVSTPLYFTLQDDLVAVCVAEVAGLEEGFGRIGRLMWMGMKPLPHQG